MTRQCLSLLELLNPMPDNFTSPLDDLNAAECAEGDHDFDIGMEDDNGPVRAASDVSVIRMDVPPSPKAEGAWEGGPKRKRQTSYLEPDETDDELSEQEQEKKK